MPPLILFAQQDDAVAAGFLASFFIFLGALVLLALLPQIFFLLTLHKALGRCRRQYRTQEPGMVWLALVPFVNLAWIFINVVRVAESLEGEFRARRWHSRNEDYGYGIGIAYCCLALASIIPYCGAVFGIAAFVCWIMYWVKVANLSGQIASPARRREPYEDDDDADYEDDRPHRRRTRDDDDYDDRGDDREDGRKPWERRGR